MDVGCVVVRIEPRAEQSLADARANFSAAHAARGGKPCPLLVDISKAAPLEPEVRHFYSGERLNDGFTALALLVEASPFGRMMGNVYLRIARPGIPTKLFTREEAAIEWLAAYVR